MATVLVTGGTGFVGANLTRVMVEAGHRVHLIVRENYNSWRIESIHQHIQLHIADLSDEEHLKTIVRAIKPDWVFHLAVHGAYSWQQNSTSILQTNLVGTMNLLNAALQTGFEVFVNTGSSSEYGYKDHAPTEDERVDPNSIYAVMKAAATMYCGYFARQHKVYVPTVRLYSVYGQWEEPKRLIPGLITYGLQGKYPPLVHPDTARDFVHVDDVATAYLKLTEKHDEDYAPIYNLGSGQQSTLQELVTICRDLLKIPSEPQWNTMQQRQWDTNIWVSDSSKMQHHYGWQPRYTIQEGLEATIAWLQTHADIRRHYEQEIFPIN
jgi:nucleoside-diphosphate-sugar epimerase